VSAKALDRLRVHAFGNERPLVAIYQDQGQYEAAGDVDAERRPRNGRTPTEGLIR
jgi:hypothetical protein